MQEIFINHEAHPLVVAHAVPSMVAAYILMMIAAAVSLKKAPGQAFMDAGQTMQLRGLAIILIVFGHLNRVLADGIHVPNFAGFGVAIFLFCSGYGLAASYIRRDFGFAEFFKKRLSRIYLPYMIVVALVLLADYALLGITYPPADTAAALAGLNILRGSEKLEYTRWFITYIILMYLFFFIAGRAAKKQARLFALFGLTAALDVILYLLQAPLDRYIHIGNFRHFMLYSMAFPVGCAAYVHRDRVEKIIGKLSGSGWTVAGVAAMVVLVFAAKTYLGDPLRQLFNRGDMASVTMEAALWQPAFLVAFAVLLALMGAFKKAGVSSVLLAFTGSISYEIYLVHSALMVRFDFLLFREPFLVFFIIYLVVVAALSLIFKRVFAGGKAAS